MPYAGKPIIGIVGGIASGKSHVSGLLRSLGGFIIDSDAIAHDMYRDPNVLKTLADWYGPGVIRIDGSVDRRLIGARVFRNADERKRLESLLHPLIEARRERLMHEVAHEKSVRAYVWDSPLLIEAGLHTQCDAILFIDAPVELRIERVKKSRGWDAAELKRRENSQLPLASKRALASDIVIGDADEVELKCQLAAILDRLCT